MAKYLYKKLKANTKSKKWDIPLLLCKGLGSTMLPHSPSSEWPDLRTYLWGNDQMPSCIQRKFSIEHKLAACVAIGDVKRVKRLLPKAAIRDDCPVYGKLLINAVILSDMELLLALTGHVRDLPGVFQAARKKSVLRDSHFGAKGPIHMSIEQGKVGFLQNLLKYLITHAPQIGKNMFHDFVSRTLRVDGAECLDAIFEWSQKIKLKDGNEASNGLFRRACLLKAHACIRVIINKDGPSLYSTISSSSPMCMAIRTNCGATVEAVINAGAGINFRVQFGPNNDMHTPLEFALCSKNFNVVKALIRAGADLPPLSTWPLYYTTDKTLQKVRFDRQGVEVPKFEQFKVMSKADRALL